MKMITFADGLIRLGGQELPGILLALSVDGKVRYDKQKVDGTSGENKTPQGWDDKVLSATLVLVTDDMSDCYDKLGEIEPLFQTPDSKANPQIYSISNRHAQKRGLRQVVFDKFTSREDANTDEIFVSISFTEHRPPIIRTEGNVAKTPTPAEIKEQAEQAAKGQGSGPMDDSIILVDLEGSPQ